MTRIYTLFCLIACLLSSAQQASAQQRDAQAEALIAKWINAAGGPKIWDNVRDLRYTVTTVWYDTTGKEVRRRPRYVWIKKSKDGFRVRVERTEAEGKYIQIWNNGAFASLNGKVLDDTVRAAREVGYVAGDLTYWVGLPWKLRDPGVNVLLQQPNVVHVTFGAGVGAHDGDRYWYYWNDPNSPLPTEVHYIEQGQTEADRKRIQFRDPQQLGPGIYFGRRAMVSANGTPVRDLIMSDVVVNRGIADSVFVNDR